jgi:hypothetical protein
MIGRFILAVCIASLMSVGAAPTGTVPRAVASANEQTTTLGPSHTRDALDWGAGGGFADDDPLIWCGAPGGRVGYGHTTVAHVFGADTYLSCVYDLAVRFDLSEIHQHAGAIITHAELLYDEQQQREDLRDADGNPADPATIGGAQSGGYESCIWQLRVPTENWTEWPDFHRGLIPADEDPRIARLGTTRWDVTNQASHWYFGWQQDPDENFGLVLRGYDEQLAFSNNAACLSTLGDLKLVVSYTSNDPAPPPPPPPPPKPDLQVARIDVTDKSGAAGCVSGTVAVAATVHNGGNLDSGAIDVLLNVDGQPQATDAGVTVGAGADARVTFAAFDLAAGTHTIQVVADPDGALAESDEKNNAAHVDVTCASGAAPRPAARPADLQVATTEVKDKTGAPGCVAGSDNRVEVHIKNAGDADVNAVFSVQLKVDGKASGGTTVGGVAAGTTKTAVVSGVSLGKGHHTVLVTVDPDHAVTEANEQNNTATIQVTCTKG